MSKTTNRFAPEVRQRMVRMVLDHEADYPSRWAVLSFPEQASAYFAQAERAIEPRRPFKR